MSYLVILLGIPITILHGWILSLLWKWFFVPIFALPELRLIEAIGIMIVIGFIRHRAVWSREEDRQAIALHGVIDSLIAPFIFLAFGWIVRSFM